MPDHLRLDSPGSTLVIAIDDGTPSILHWGEVLDPDEDIPSLRAAQARPVPHAGLEQPSPISLMADAGRGYRGHPGLAVHRGGQDFVTDLRVETLSCTDDAITLNLVDAQACLAVSLIYRLDHRSDVLEIGTIVTNTGNTSLQLDWCASLVLPVPAQMAELVASGGRWCREFVLERTPLPARSWLAENRTGRTSHQNVPALTLGSAGFSETSGLIFGAVLAWSGNHRILLDRLADDRRVLQCGSLFLPGEVILAAGASHKVPPAYATCSGAGLGTYSAKWHRFVRDRVLPTLHGPRKVHLNTWEAIYFDHDVPTLQRLADAAAAIGVERFVLDDGWFLNRSDDHRALGDWTADPTKYPDGLTPLIDHVRALGMEFGLWVEPEMVNPDSDLFRAHPDWILNVPGRPPITGRHQYVLDLGRPEVFTYLFDALDQLLTANAIGYLKWDMNRDLTAPGHDGVASVDQQTRAVYHLIDKLRARHPYVEIESCASGGARADFGILARTHRVWPSDCNDALERIAILRGFGLYLPPEIMGAHIGPRPAHTTGRRLDFGFQAAVALFGHFGLELDVTKLDDVEREMLGRWIARYKQHRALLHAGVSVRLEADDTGLIANGVIAHDREEALICCARVSTSPAIIAPPLRLPGLDPARRYAVRIIERTDHHSRQMRKTTSFIDGEIIRLSGAALAAAGVQLPNLAPESAVLIHVMS